MINVYPPQDLLGKQELWIYNASFIHSSGGNYGVFSDNNVIKSGLERYGSVFCHNYATCFNDFIDEIGVVDVPIIGKRFTRSDTTVSKLSKLDRFLVFEDFYDKFQSLHVAVLDRKWSNHCHILLHDLEIDYGLSSFKFFNSWLHMDGFDEVVRGALGDFVVD